MRWTTCVSSTPRLHRFTILAAISHVSCRYCIAQEVSQCYTGQECTRMDTFLRDLSAVNDGAESCVKAISEYANLTHDSAYREDIFVIVHSHWDALQELRMDALANVNLIQIALQKLKKRRVIIVVYCWVILHSVIIPLFPVLIQEKSVCLTIAHVPLYRGCWFPCLIIISHCISKG